MGTGGLMAADMMENEMADLHRELDENEGTKSCKAHIHVVAAEKKSLRVCEQILKNQKYFMGILFSILVSVWAKGTPIGDIVGMIVKAAISTATGGTP